MFANKRLSQVDKHNAAKFQNVVKTNSRDQQKGLCFNSYENTKNNFLAIHVWGKVI